MKLFRLNYISSLTTFWINKVSRDCCMALPHDAMGLSAVCDCGIS